MEEDTKKISFGFSRLTKKPAVIQKPTPQKQNNIQLIDCLEGQRIKLKDAVEEKKGLLVIPMLSTKTIFDYQGSSNIKLTTKVKEDEVDDRRDSELTADELAARELIREVQNSFKKNNVSSVLTLPAVMQNSFQIEGKEEPTIDDYETVPVSEYGMAMLRGMGWSETTGVGKIPGKNKSTTDEPMLRPKGLGLGANKLKNYVNKSSVNNKDGEKLILRKGCCAKIVEGKYKESYCEVQGFDEDGRVIVKTTVTGLIINLNEFMVQPVSKEEYSRLSKVINNVKFEEFKNKVKTAETKITKDVTVVSGNSRSRRVDPESSNLYARQDHKDTEEDKHYLTLSKSKYRSNSSDDSDYRKRKDSRSHTKSKHKSRKSRRKKRRSSSDYETDHKNSRKSYSNRH